MRKRKQFNFKYSIKNILNEERQIKKKSKIISTASNKKSLSELKFEFSLFLNKLTNNRLTNFKNQSNQIQNILPSQNKTKSSPFLFPEIFPSSTNFKTSILSKNKSSKFSLFTLDNKKIMLNNKGNKKNYINLPIKKSKLFDESSIKINDYDNKIVKNNSIFPAKCRKSKKFITEIVPNKINRISDFQIKKINKKSKISYSHVKSIINLEISNINKRDFKEYKDKYLNIKKEDLKANKINKFNWSGNEILNFNYSIPKAKKIFENLNNLEKNIWVLGIKGYVIIELF